MTGAAAQTDLLQTLIVFRPTFHVYQQYLPNMNSEPLWFCEEDWLSLPFWE